MALDLSSLEKAISSLAISLEVYNNAPKVASAEKEILRDGVIQRFEYTFELSWKMLKRYLDVYGLDRSSGLTNKELFRIGFENQILRDAEPWMDFLAKRNLTSHTYDEAKAEEVFEVIESFLREATYLLERLQAKNE